LNAAHNKQLRARPEQYQQHADDSDKFQLTRKLSMCAINASVLIGVVFIKQPDRVSSSNSGSMNRKEDQHKIVA
jgi:hypothetical protein